MRGAGAGVRHWAMPVQRLVEQLALPAARVHLMLVEEVEAPENGREVMARVLWGQQQQGVVVALKEVPMEEVLEQRMEAAEEELQGPGHRATEVGD